MKIRLSSLIFSLLAPFPIMAAPQDHGRIIDEDGGSWISPEVGLIGMIILFIITVVGYFALKDENGKKDDGCGCLLIMMIVGIILGIIIVFK